MDSKKFLGILFSILGAIAMAVGIMSIFNGGESFGQNSWGVAIIGVVFFIAGMGLMQSVGKGGGGEPTA